MLGPALVAVSSRRAGGAARDPPGPVRQWTGPEGRLPGDRGLGITALGKRSLPAPRGPSAPGLFQAAVSQCVTKDPARSVT